MVENYCLAAAVASARSASEITLRVPGSLIIEIMIFRELETEDVKCQAK